MSVTLYTPSLSKIVHDAKVDFRQRVIQPVIHIVQYDKSLPIVAVKLYNNGIAYALPVDADVSVRWGKRDHTFVYNAVLGCNSDRTIVYFEITEQMTVFYGEHDPIIELRNGTSLAGSGYMSFYIDRNPIQNGDVASHVELTVLDNAVNQAQAAAAEAAESAEYIRVARIPTGEFTIALPTATTAGQYWIFTGTEGAVIGGFTWHKGDYAMWLGANFTQLDNTTAVRSVNGMTGAVTIDGSNLQMGSGDTRYIKEVVDMLTIPDVVTTVHQSLTSEITATNTLEINDDTGKVIKIEAGSLIENIIINGDFTNGLTNWVPINSTISVVGENLLNTGNGGGSTPYSVTYSFTPPTNTRVYAISRVKVTNSVAAFIQVFAYDSIAAKSYNFGTSVYSPSANIWYNFSTIFTTPVNPLAVRIYHSYADAATANGKVMTIDYVRMYNVDEMIAKGVKDDNGISFSELTDGEIKLQLDIWVTNGFPTVISKLISKSDNLFNSQFSPVSSLDSEDIVTNGNFINGTTDWTSAGGVLTAAGGVLTDKSTGQYQNSTVLRSNVFTVGNKSYFKLRFRVTNSKCTYIELNEPHNYRITTPVQNQWYEVSVANTNSYPGIYIRHAYASTADSLDSVMEIDYVKAVNITDLVTRGILPVGLSNTQYKEMLNEKLFDNVSLRETDFIAVESGSTYKLIKASSNAVTHKVIEYTADNQIVKVNTITYTANKSQVLTMNALTKKIKIVSDLMSKPNQLIAYPDFNTLSGWTNSNCTSTVSNSVRTLTPTGATSWVGLAQYFSSASSQFYKNNDYYFKFRVRVTTANITISGPLYASPSNEQLMAGISSPVVNQWYELSGVYKILAQDPSTGAYIKTNFEKKAAITNEQFVNERGEVDTALAYNMTEFKEKGVRNDSGTLFSKMTNSEIKTQMDLWVAEGFPDHVINALYPNGVDSAIAFKYNDADDTFRPQQQDELPLGLTLRQDEYWQDGYIVKQNGNAEYRPLDTIFSAWNYGQLEAVYTTGLPVDFTIQYSQNTAAQVQTATEYLGETRTQLDYVTNGYDSLVEKLGEDIFEDEYDSYAGVTSSDYEYYGLEGIKAGNKIAIEGYGQEIKNLLDSTKITATQTSDGLTITYDAETGIFNVNGTFSSATAKNYTLATGMDFGLSTGTALQLMRYYDSGTINLDGSYVGYVLSGTSVSNRINENSESLYDPYINASGNLTANHVTNKQQILFQVWKQGMVFTDFKFKLGIYEGLTLRPFILPTGETAESEVSIYNKTINKLNLPSVINTTVSGVTVTYDPVLQEFVLSGTASATTDISLTATFAVKSGDRLSIKRQYQSGDIASAGGVLPRIKLINGATTVVYNDIYKMTAPEGETPTPDVSFNTGTAASDLTVTLKLGITSGQIFSDYRFRLMIHNKSTDVGYALYERTLVGTMYLGKDEEATVEFNAIDFGAIECVAATGKLNLVFANDITDITRTRLDYNAGLISPNRKIAAIDARLTAIDNPFQGKVVAIWGDSRESNNPTSDPGGVGDQKDTSWPALLGKKLGATVLNYGLSGGAWAQNTVQQDAASAIVNRVQTEDPSASADIVIISSMNDFKLYTTLGSPEPSNKTITTFYGAIRLTFDRLAAKYPGKRIWVVLPQKRFDETTNYGGGLYVDYRKAQLDVCREYGIPTIDLYNDFPNTKPTFYATNMLNDTHFSAVGNDLVAELVTRALIGNGNSAAEIVNTIYGNMYLADNTTVAALTQNTLTKFAIPMTGAISNGITVSTANDNIIIVKSGIYQITASFGTLVSVNDLVLDSAFYKNTNTRLTQLQQRRTAKNANENNVTTIQGIVSLVAGDVLDFRISASASCDITIRNASISILKII